MISQGSVSLPVSSFSTLRRNCSLGSTRALCNQVAQSNSCPSLLLPALPAPVLLSSPPASVHVSLAAADARELTSSNRPSFSIPESASPGTHQTTSTSLGASTARPALRTDIFPIPQTWYLSPPLCAAPRPISHRFW